MTGIVYKSTGSWYSVKTSDGIFINCRIKGRFRKQGIKSTNPIAVGDFVDFNLETTNDKPTGVINNIHDRTNYIVRRSVNLSKQTHIIASNIDQVFLLITIEDPLTSTTFIDRFLVSAEAHNIKTILLFNKVDSYKWKLMNEANDLIQVYSKIGYECLKISAKERLNISSVHKLMLNKTSMFSGHSGVGKSTLINSIEPSLNLKTMETSAIHRQGQHTTTFAEMFDLSFGARIIDTPGIKGFGLVNMNYSKLDQYFPDFCAVKARCKFNNCLHLHEPNCAVKDELKNGSIAKTRYDSYIQILESSDENYRINRNNDL
tara:strand:- start:2027 stop:2977 length:951 start_codon:yes stop_codon:yes gene_type:complete